MKRIILIVGVVLTALVSNAQNTVQSPPKNEKVEYSYLWGLVKSKDYTNGNSVVFGIEKPKFSISLTNAVNDTVKYERKSILWGAIQWTEKKKSKKLIKT